MNLKQIENEINNLHHSCWYDAGGVCGLYVCRECELKEKLMDFWKEIENHKAAIIADNHKLAKEFSEPGTVKNFMIRQGFLPDNEQKAEALIISIIESEEKLQERVKELEQELNYLKEGKYY